MTFYDRLTSIQRTQHSLLCVGLDTHLNKLPSFLTQHPDPILEFNRRIIDATKDIVCAYKINLAFYEALGKEGWRTLRETLEYIPKNVITIGDAKRGDIGNTAELYAKAMIDEYGFSASTVNPYMGEDSVAPFTRHPEHGVFVLALTSNPGAKDFQYLTVNAAPLYETVIARVRTWNTNKNCGLVAGATRPEEMQRIRTLAGDMPLLIPGIGAQGGDLEAAIRYGCDAHGLMAIINASRSILYASSNEDFDRAARRVAMELRDEINAYRKQFFS